MRTIEHSRSLTTTLYAELLQLAEKTESRKDAIYYIREADKLRNEMNRTNLLLLDEPRLI